MDEALRADEEPRLVESGGAAATEAGVAPAVAVGGAVAANRALSGALPNQAVLGTEAPFPILPGGREEEESARSALQRAARAALRAFVDKNRMASHRLNLRCEERFGRVDGSRQFHAHLERVLRPGLRVIDLGGGKHPAISGETKERLGLQVVGVDVSADELRLAPPGAYDRTVVADATRFVERESADLVIAQALAEHVSDTGELWRRAYECLVPGGRVLQFVPNGRALFARLNRLLPEDTKRWLLYRIYPEAVAYQGFPAHYDRCTPTETRKMLRAIGFRDVDVQPYFSSNYFVFFYPAHVANVALQVLAKALDRDDACESFVVEAVK